MSKTDVEKLDDATAVSNLEVSDFRLILQWPLVLDSNASTKQNAADNTWIKEQIISAQDALTAHKHWEPVEDPINYPPTVDPSKFDGGGYAQFAYFHDFVQKFLFSAGKSPALHLFERTDMKDLHLRLSEQGQRFSFGIDRLSLHLFTFGTAIMTLELAWKPSEKQVLYLSDTQDIIDSIRRTYTPFWENGTPARVPFCVEIPHTDYIESKPYTQKVAEAHLMQSGKNCALDIKVFEHWEKMIEPLELLCNGGHWRDPSDERMPINSYIVLACEEGNEQDTILSVRESDWMRLMDAEKSGQGMPYNDAFLRPILHSKCYDRFFPGKHNTWAATRQIIDAAHYCVVTAGKFGQERLVHHFRRHYTLLSLIARFEVTALLAISSRLTNAVILYEESGDDKQFEEDIIAIQGQFLGFTHRFRFTGVSSQLQPSEMFAMWRTALGLDKLFEDVRTEVETAFQRVSALQQQREAEAATDLSKLAGVGVVLGLVAGVMGANLFVGNDAVSDIKELTIVVAIVLGVVTIGMRFTLSGKTKLGREWPLNISLFCLLCGIASFFIP